MCKLDCNLVCKFLYKEHQMNMLKLISRWTMIRLRLRFSLRLKLKLRELTKNHLQFSLLLSSKWMEKVLKELLCWGQESRLMLPSLSSSWEYWNFYKAWITKSPISSLRWRGSISWARMRPIFLLDLRMNQVLGHKISKLLTLPKRTIPIAMKYLREMQLAAMRLWTSASRKRRKRT
jgi:hypothetical protein